MPVYDRGYTHWENSGKQAWPAWWVIARRGIARPFKSRWMILLVLLPWITAIIKAVNIYIKLKAGDLAELLGGDWWSIEPQGFLTFIEGQRFFIFLLLAIIGAGLVANDRRDNGLSLYFSRPLGLKSYVGGKALVLLFYYFMATLFQVYVLCLFAYLIAPGATGLEMLVLIPLRATVYCIFSGLSTALVLLAFSSLGKRTIFVMVWWTILVMGTESLGNIAAGFGKDSLQVLNFLGNYHNFGSLVFGAEPQMEISVWVSGLVILAWTAVAIWILHRQIRPVEVVT